MAGHQPEPALLVAVVVPALMFASIPTGIVAIIERYDIDPEQLYQIERYLANFPGLPPKWRRRASSS